MARLKITPLDPNSDKGREVAERLTETLAGLQLAVAARKRAAARNGQAERGAT